MYVRIAMCGRCIPSLARAPMHPLAPSTFPLRTLVTDSKHNKSRSQPRLLNTTSTRKLPAGSGNPVSKFSPPSVPTAQASTTPSAAFKDPVILPLRTVNKKAPLPSSTLSSKPVAPPPPTATEPVSKRKQFKAIRYLPETLAHIRSAGLGEHRWPATKPEDHAFLYPRPGKQPLDFVAAAKSQASFWPNAVGLPEMAVIGRSNVGKSRLLNATFGTSVVRVKDKPGLTQSINWYQAAGPLRALVVDMPGYGFAFAKHELKENWDRLILDFLARDTLVRLFVLVDARHGLKVNDVEFLEKLKGMNHFRLTIIMTKCDLVRMEILARQHRLVCNQVHGLLGIPAEEVLMVSSRSGAGIVSLRESILQHVKSLAHPPRTE